MPRVDWTDFSMRPVHPTQGSNPVVRTLNMVKRSDGAIHIRPGFAGAAGPGGGVQNATTVELDGTPYLVVKTQEAVRFAQEGGAFQTITDPASDPVLGGAIPQSDCRGSFARHGGELYYCDCRTVFAWDGTSSEARRPGVVSMSGLKYNRSIANGGFGFGAPGEDDDSHLYDPIGNNFLPTRPPGEANGVDPFVKAGFSFATKHEGEKTLNTGFALGWYDPKRRIYGARSEVFSLPYLFGPVDGGNLLLSDERAQYAKYVRTPDAPAGHPDYRVAIWFTLGQQVLTQSTSIIFGEGSGYFNTDIGVIGGQYAPAMSKKMTEMLFLETIADAGRNATVSDSDFPATSTGADLETTVANAPVKCTKSNARLLESGRYIDVYDRPVPAKHLVILPNGVAVYIRPWINEDQTPGSATLGNYAEYSVGHPEQIGRNESIQRFTFSHISNLNGDPVASISDDSIQLLLTKQAVYQVGFNGKVLLRELAGGRGVRSEKSIATGNPGAFWYSDDGVVWVQGGRSVLLDKRIGFQDWFDKLDPDDRDDVVIGVSDVTNEIIVWAQDYEAPAKQRAMVFDWEQNFACEFNLGGAGLGGGGLGVGITVSYAIHFRGSTESRLFCFRDSGAGLRYPEIGTYQDSGQDYNSLVIAWLNENQDRRKRISDVLLDLGECDGDVTVTIWGLRSGDVDEDEDIDCGDGETHTVSVASGAHGQRYSLRETYKGMRGNLFKIQVKGPLGVKWSMSRLSVEYELDEDGDARSI